jgi:hypothetical protein
MRTEDDLRDAFAALERHAPSAAMVLPGARRKSAARHWRMPGLTAVGAAAAAAAVVVAMAVTGTPAHTGAADGSQDAALRTAILTAFSSASNEILYVHESSLGFGAGGAGRDDWYSPWLAQPGQKVRVRSLLRYPDGQPQQDVGETYTVPSGGIPATVPSLQSEGTPVLYVTATTTYVDYASRSWWSVTHRGDLGPMLDDPAVIRDEIAQGHWLVVGHPTVNGQATIELRLSVSGSYPAWLRSVLAMRLWVNAKTYLPVQEKATGVTSVRKGHVSTYPTFLTFQLLPTTAANLAQLQVTVPAGFRYAP